MKTNNDIKIHHVANLFPMMSESEFAALKEDIQKNGLQNPIYLFNGEIIDGRNRFKACQELKSKPKFETFKGNESELIDFVISLNFHRRHLTTSQKSCLAVEIMPEIEKQTKENLSKKMSAIRKNDIEVSAKLQNLNSSGTLSKLFGVSERYIFEAKKLKEISPELFHQVKHNIDNMTLQKAKAKLKNVATGGPAAASSNAADISVKLTNIDNKKISELVDYGMNKQKATEFITTKKKQRLEGKQSPKNTTSKDMKEVKFRVDGTTKDYLLTYAKNQNKSISEVMRELLQKQIKRK